MGHIQKVEQDLRFCRARGLLRKKPARSRRNVEIVREINEDVDLTTASSLANVPAFVQRALLLRL
jgi:hypothetical protein